MTSRGYVKKTEIQPAIDPDANLRMCVSLSREGMTTARTCSYAKNLIPAYGKIRNNVAECPRKSPNGPSWPYISFIAYPTPLQLPAYFLNSGFAVWKRTLTRSRGATNVFACISLLVLVCNFSQTARSYSTSRQPTRQATLERIFHALLVHFWLRIGHNGIGIGGT